MLSQLLHIPLTTEKLKLIPDLKLTVEQQAIVNQIIAGTFTVPTPETKGQDYNVKLYQELYPYLALAYSFEQNGVIEEHTKKLAALFDNAKDALQYLRSFHEKNISNTQFVHDACLFQLPESKNFSVWKKLAKKHLLENSFKKILGLGDKIEKQIANDQKEKEGLILQVFNRHADVKIEKPPLTSLQIKTVKEKISKEIKEKNDFCKRFKSHHAEMRLDEKKVEMNKRYLKDLDDLHNDRAILHLEKNRLDQYSFADLIDVNHRLLKTGDNWARNFFLKLGISEQYYNKFLDLDRSHAGENIPNIGILDCGNGFYMKKLNVANETEGAVAACLGKLTDCCQSLSGETGEPCTIHGLTHPDSGFYVLFKGDAKNPKITDTVYGQTWVNRTASGALLFDSIESSQGKFNPEYAGKRVSQAFNHLARHLVINHEVPYVKCGMRSGISYMLNSHSDYQLPAESPKDYQGYRDSHEQGLLSHAELLNPFNEKNEIKVDTKGIKSMGPRAYLLKASKDLTTENLIELLLYFISKSDSDSINYMLDNALIDLSEVNFTDLKGFELSLRSMQSTELQEVGPILKKILPSETNLVEILQNNYHKLAYALISTGAFIKSENSKADTPLHIAARKGLTSIAEALIEQKVDVNARNKSQDTPLAIAAFYGFHKVAQKLIEAKANLNVQDPAGDTPLISATFNGHKDMVEMLISSKVNINLKNNNNESALTWAINKNHEPLIYLLMDAKADVNVKSKESDYPIFMAINNRSVKLTEALVEHKADLNLLNKEGKSPLMLAVEGGSLDLVHCLLKHKNRDFNQKNLKGETALDVAVLGGDCYMVIELIYANLACKIPQLQFFLEEQLKINPLDHDLKMAYSHFKKTYLSDEPKVEPTQSIKPMLDKTTTKITT